MKTKRILIVLPGFLLLPALLFTGCASSKPVRAKNTVALRGPALASSLAGAGDAGLLRASSGPEDREVAEPGPVGQTVLKPRAKERVFYYGEMTDGAVRSGPTREYVHVPGEAMVAAHDGRASLARACELAGRVEIVDGFVPPGVRSESWTDPATGRQYTATEGPAVGEGFDHRIYRRLNPARERVMYFPAMIEEGRLVPPTRLYVKLEEEGFAGPPSVLRDDVVAVAAPLSELEDPNLFGSGVNPLTGVRQPVAEMRPSKKAKKPESKVPAKSVSYVPSGDISSGGMPLKPVYSVDEAKAGTQVVALENFGAESVARAGPSVSAPAPDAPAAVSPDSGAVSITGLPARGSFRGEVVPGLFYPLFPGDEPDPVGRIDALSSAHGLGDGRAMRWAGQWGWFLPEGVNPPAILSFGGSSGAPEAGIGFSWDPNAGRSVTGIKLSRKVNGVQVTGWFFPVGVSEFGGRETALGLLRGSDAPKNGRLVFEAGRGGWGWLAPEGEPPFGWVPESF